MDELRETLANNLLELDKKNKLINFNDYKLKSIEIVRPSLEEVFNMVSSGYKISLANLDFINKNNNNKDTEKSNLQLLENLELKKNQILAYKKDIDSQIILKKIMDSKKEIEKEKGLNTLYLTFGFLKWSESDNSDIFYNSPILLVPVNMEYDSTNKIYSLKRTDEDIVLNPTLKYKMLKEFDLTLPEFTSASRTITEYLNTIKEKINLHWQILNKIYLGIFSFSKITMYNDLIENYDKMISSEIVNSMYHNNAVFSVNELEHNYEQFFEKGKDVELFNVVNADSSQIEAIVEAKRGKSFVIQGPPGTGKSQTITNLIAELIHDGKKVLFVSEKKAALDVVYNNLCKVNLEKFCVQIHSDKSIKKQFIDDLYNCFQHTNIKNSQREFTLAKLKENKRKLDNYIALIYKNIDCLNLTIHDLIEKVSEYKKNFYNEYKVKNIAEKNLDYLYDVTEKLSLYAATEYSENLLFNPWLGYDINVNINKDELNRRVFTTIKYIIAVKEKYDMLSKIFELEWDTFDQIKNNSFYLKFINELPCADKKLLIKNTREKIAKTLSKIYLSLDQINKIENNLLKRFNRNVFEVNCVEFLEKFSNIYRSSFMIFNSEYKKDIKSLRKHLIKPNKINYSEAVDLLNLIKKRNELLKEVDEDISKMNLFTDYKYPYGDYDSFSDIQKKVNEYVNTYNAFPFTILNTDNFENSIDLSRQLYKLLNDDNDWKIKDLQSLFDRKFFAISDINIDKTITRLKSLNIDNDEFIERKRNFSLVKDLNELGVIEFIEFAKEQSIDKYNLKNSFKYSFYNSWLSYLTDCYSELRNFRRENQDLAVNNFVKYDDQILEQNRIEIQNTLNERISRYINYRDICAQQAIKILQREAHKKKMLKPIRQLIEEIPDLIFTLKPCFLMSPLSVSTYLQFDNNLFDVVIFDEASQIFPWDAIGAISRSNSTIIVGDSKQMPPTNFFLVNNSDIIEDSDEDVQDFESILDLSCASLPQIMLKWHYRSNDESLIAFSNKNFYDNKLITFPTPFVESNKTGIHFHYVQNGVYIKNQNEYEAKQVVQLILEFAEKYPNNSLGVVCFNIKQQDLILDYIEKYLNDPRYIDFFKEDKPEPFFIKNLETVQGDERDTIIFSIGYGKDLHGNLAHRFGPLNRKGGERRLNVAVTRAKNSVEVVSSIRASDINLERTQSLGVKLLKEYLNVAEKGIGVLNDEIFVNKKALPESYFEEQVSEFISSKGYSIELQVGSSGFRIDIGVKHPNKDDFILAIECDGETYHSSRTARERDKIRQQMLERQGWKFYRIWSTDWFNNRKVEEKKLIDAIENAISTYDKKEIMLGDENGLKIVNNLNEPDKFKAIELASNAIIDNSQLSKENIVDPIQKDLDKVSLANELETNFYKDILRKIKNPKYSFFENKYANVVDEVVKYFFDMLFIFEAQDHKATNKEDFFNNLYQAKHTYRFFEFTFGLSTITINVIREVYIAFVASKIIELIKERETIFHKSIIIQDKKFILFKSLIEKLKTDNYAIYSCDGVNSNISLIPDDVFDNIIKSYKRYIID